MGTLTHPIRTDDGAGGGLMADGLLSAFALAEGEVMEQLTERFDLFDSGAIYLVGDVAGSQSDTLRERFMNVGWHLSMDATAAETTDVTPSDVGDATSDIAVARRALGLSFSQFAQIVGGRLVVDPSRLAFSLVDSFRRGRMKHLITTGQSLATTDVDGTDYNDADDLFVVMDRASALGVEADTPIHMLMRGSGQWNRIRDSLRSEVGPMGYRQDAQDVFSFKAAGFTAQIFGINIWTTGRISASGGKYTGFWWVPGTIGYAIGSTGSVLSNAMLRDPGIPCVVSWLEKPGSATGEIYGNGYDGSDIMQEIGGLFKGKE